MTGGIRRGAIAALVALLALAGCAAPGETTTPIYVAISRQAAGGGGMTALLEGRITTDLGCLWVDSGAGAGRFLPVWPRGTRAFGVIDGPEVMLEAGGQRLVSGTEVALGGGTPPSTVDDIEPTLIQAVPDACRDAQFWIVNGVELRAGR